MDAATPIFFLPDAIFASPLCVYLQLKETSIQNTTKETFSIMLIELRNTAVLTNMLDSAHTHIHTHAHTEKTEGKAAETKPNIPIW